MFLKCILSSDYYNQTFKKKFQITFNPYDRCANFYEVKCTKMDCHTIYSQEEVFFELAAYNYCG
jgi:hypothetical protein